MCLLQGPAFQNIKVFDFCSDLCYTNKEYLGDRGPRGTMWPDDMVINSERGLYLFARMTGFHPLFMWDILPLHMS